MKKELLFISAFLLLVLSGCVNETLQPESSKELKVSVSLASVQTKTYLGEVDGNVRQVYWSVGDAVSMNGFESDVLTADQAGKATADFKFYNGSVPYRVIYPASICKEFTPDGMVTVDVPATQEYSSSSFGKGAAILYGYSESEDEPVILHNLCAAVKVSLNSASGISVSKAAIISNSAAAPVAGKFIIDPKTGQYNVSEGLASINLNIEEVSLEGDGEQSFYFTVPYGEYPEGFTVKFYDSENYPMECRWLSNGENGVKIEAGKLYEFTPVDFVPGKKEILTGEDWLYIATCINKADNSWKSAYLDDKTNTIRLGADIVLPEGTPQITKDFVYVLDGQGYTLTNNSATASLIKTLPASGAIRNLTIAGTMRSSSETENVELAAFVHTVSGGSIEDCTNEMGFEVSAKTVLFGAFARTITAGQIVRCVNNADMTIMMDVTKATTEDLKTIKSFGGGLVATCFSPIAFVLVEDCVNNGDVNVTIDAGTAAGVNRAGFAGILGYVSGSTTENYPRLVNCTNNGNVQLSFVENVSSRAKAQYSVGGIVGLAAGVAASASGLNTGALSAVDSGKHCYMYLDSCTNTGRVQNNATSSGDSADPTIKIYTGGIAGTVIGLGETTPTKIINCVNTGEVVPYSVKVNHYQRAAICGVCGGFLGLGAYVDIEGGMMNAKVGTAETHSFATAGVIGLAWSKFSIKSLKVNAYISRVQSSDHSADNHALAVANSTTKIKTDLTGSVISDCSFAGSFFIGTTAKYTDKPVVPTNVEYVTSDDILRGAKIVSASYTKGGITMENNTYWSNVNAQ